MNRAAALAIIAIAAIGAAPSPDYSALCSGWAGRWTIMSSTDRDDDGSWKTEDSEPDWSVEPLGQGKCAFTFSAVRFAVDTSNGDYRTTDLKEGKPGAQAVYQFTRADIEDARSWTVEVVQPPGGSAKEFTRLTMVMAGDNFAIIGATKADAAAPYRMASYTVHRRKP